MLNTTESGTDIPLESENSATLTSVFGRVSGINLFRIKDSISTVNPGGPFNPSRIHPYVQITSLKPGLRNVTNSEKYPVKQYHADTGLHLHFDFQFISGSYGGFV